MASVADGPALRCSYCKAPLGLPDDLDATVTTCAHCGQVTPLAADLVEERQRQARAIDQRRAEAAERAEQGRWHRRQGRLWTIYIGGFVAVILAIVAFTVGRDLLRTDQRAPATPATAPAPAALDPEAALDTRDRATVATDQVDPPQREEVRDDPGRNGVQLVGARMDAMLKAGCTRVLLPPHAVAGDQHLTATIERGAYCAVIVAASPVAENRLRARLASPTGKIVAEPEPASEIEIAHCADITGPHEITIAPSAPDYYAVGGVDCPRSAIKRLRSRPRRR